MGTRTEEIIIKVRDEGTGRLKNSTKTITEMGTGFKNVSKFSTDANGSFKKTADSVKSLTTNVERFNFAWLSIMFGGMQIQRTMQRVATSTTSMFTKVMSTVEGATTSISMLSVNFEYLKFTIGQAIDTGLALFMPYIIELVQWLADLINNNPEVVFWGIVGALGAGVALFQTGQWALFFMGMKSLLVDLGAMSALGGIGGALGLATATALIAGLGATAISFFFNKDEIMKDIDDLVAYWGEADWKGVLKAGTSLLLDLQEGWSKFQTWFGEKTATLMVDLGVMFYNAISAAGDLVVDWWKKTSWTEFLVWFGQRLVETLVQAVMLFSTGLSADFWTGVIKASKKGSKATGGRIPEEGMYYLHQGETVTPANMTNMGGVTINVNGASNPDYVAEVILNKIKQYSMVR